MTGRTGRETRALLGAAVAALALACGGQGSGDAAASADTGRAARQQLPLPTAEDSLPEGLTPEMVKRGRQLYRDRGLCYSCHGMRGRGVPRAGSSLRDDEWLHADGSYRSILARVANGVTVEVSESGMPMPPRGGADLTDDEVRAVAGWVWWMSR